MIHRGIHIENCKPFQPLQGVNFPNFIQEWNKIIICHFKTEIDVSVCILSFRWNKVFYCNSFADFGATLTWIIPSYGELIRKSMLFFGAPHLHKNHVQFWSMSTRFKFTNRMRHTRKHFLYDFINIDPKLDQSTYINVTEMESQNFNSGEYWNIDQKVKKMNNIIELPTYWKMIDFRWTRRRRRNNTSNGI